MAAVKSHTPGRAHGVVIIRDQGSDRVIERDTLQCCHCGRHWVYQPGSGRKRGWCFRCSQVTCGSPRCHKCVPQEQMVENIERGKPLDHRPATVSVILPAFSKQE